MEFSQKSLDFFARVEFGLKLASRRFLEQKAANNETVVIGGIGEIKHVPAKELLHQQDMEMLAEHLKNAQAKYNAQR